MDATDLLANLVQDERKSATITRVIIDLDLSVLQLGSSLQAHIGLTKMNTDALASAAFPDPADEVDQPGWLFRTMYDVRENDNPVFRMHWDLRAQRVLAGGEETLVFIVEGVGSGSVDLIGKGWARVLMKRP